MIEDQWQCIYSCFPKSKLILNEQENEVEQEAMDHVFKEDKLVTFRLHHASHIIVERVSINLAADVYNVATNEGSVFFLKHFKREESILRNTLPG